MSSITLLRDAVWKKQTKNIDDRICQGIFLAEFNNISLVLDSDLKDVPHARVTFAEKDGVSKGTITMSGNTLKNLKIDPCAKAEPAIA